MAAAITAGSKVFPSGGINSLLQKRCSRQHQTGDTTQATLRATALKWKLLSWFSREQIEGLATSQRASLQWNQSVLKKSGPELSPALGWVDLCRRDTEEPWRCSSRHSSEAASHCKQGYEGVQQPPAAAS